MHTIQVILFGTVFSTLTLLSYTTPTSKSNTQLSANTAKEILLTDTQELSETLTFDTLDPGQPPNGYANFEWSDASIRILEAGHLASSQPLAALINQYTADNMLTHPYLKLRNNSHWDVFDLYSFFISPAYEPQTSPRIEFNVSVVGFGTREGQVTPRMYRVGGEYSQGYPVRIDTPEMRCVAKVEISLTSQIVPEGGPFQPPFVVDDVVVGWKNLSHPDCVYRFL